MENDYQFDKRLAEYASEFISSVTWNIGHLLHFEDLLKAIGQGSPDPTAVFVDSMTVLESSSHPSIIRETLAFLHRCLDWCSPSNRLTLVSSKLFSRLLSTPHLRNLSVIEDKVILPNILALFNSGVYLSSPDFLQALSTTSDTDPQIFRDLVLNEVLIPIEPSLVQISRNPHLLSWKEEYKNTLQLLTEIFEVSALHQPTLDSICSSRIPMVFQSLLSKVEDEDTHQLAVWTISYNISKWQTEESETAGRGRILLQTLEQEGFRDYLEQTLFHDTSSLYGKDVRDKSFSIVNTLGMNSPEPR
ncbi:hypothetical protein BLNAU_10209 [Blattamonas nauphoetae]|uniref:Cytosolic fatty-acid binding proteins domain-containing protein n=1 Tax=Blattamonas nauphoetae TaxID=2049346 RepID=A0ABQ9XTS6_9EUKA|nr:hypothetical protein BLNAU_10209 [Blattamonas nauphoetae]